LRPWHLSQCAPILGPIGDQREQGRLRDHSEKICEQRLADLVDPMRVLHDVNRRGFSGQRSGVHHCSQPAPTRIGIDPRKRGLGIADTEQILKEQRVLGLGVRKLTPDKGACGFYVQTVDAGGSAHQARHDMEWDLAGVRLAESGEHLHTALSSHRCNLSGQSALTNARWPRDADHTAMAVECTVQQALDGGHLPPSTHQARLGPPHAAVLLAYTKETSGGHRFVGTLDLSQFRLTQSREALDESRGGCAEHHPTLSCNRLHPLRHANMLTDGGVTERA
jgi:hypothetical protein